MNPVLNYRKWNSLCREPIYSLLGYFSNATVANYPPVECLHSSLYSSKGFSRPEVSIDGVSCPSNPPLSILPTHFGSRSSPEPRSLGRSFREIPIRHSICVQECAPVQEKGECSNFTFPILLFLFIRFHLIFRICNIYSGCCP